MTGSVHGPFGTLPLRAVRVLESATSARVIAQRFTLIFSPLKAEGTPISGFGYGVGSLTASGLATISGCLADGTSFNQSVTLSQDGEWPFRVVQTVGRESRTVTGVLQGWLNVSNGIPSGSLVWWLPARSNATYYAQGFTNTLTATGSPYTPESPDKPALPLNQPEFLISSPEIQTNLLLDTLINSSTLTGSGGRLKLNFYRSSGLLTGTLSLGGDTNRSLVIKGIILQPGHCARGFVSGPGQTGAFMLRESAASRGIKRDSSLLLLDGIYN
jgi:hypothetical protein